MTRLRRALAPNREPWTFKQAALHFYYVSSLLLVMMLTAISAVNELS